jgi:hypothetical protein
MLVMPPAFCLFVFDRVISLMLPNIAHPSFREWINKEKVLHAIMRISTVLILYGLYKLFI